VILFKFPHLKEEFEGKHNDSGYSIHPRLQAVIFALAGLVQYYFNKDICITGILRTQIQQDQLYRGKIKAEGEKYELKPWKSPHQFGCAADIRTSDFEPDEIEHCLNFLNETFEYGSGGKKTAIYHDIGSGAHLHLQVKPA
jgi:hypothetical protein